MSISSAVSDVVSLLSADPFRHHSEAPIPASMATLRALAGFDNVPDETWETVLEKSQFRCSLVFPGFLYRETSAGVVEFASVEAAALELRSKTR